MKMKYWKAAKLLEKKGWCQGEFENKKGEHCMLGALGLRRTPEELRQFLPEEEVAVTFNDTPGRTIEEVIDVLVGVAVMLEK